MSTPHRANTSQGTHHRLVRMPDLLRGSSRLALALAALLTLASANDSLAAEYEVITPPDEGILLALAPSDGRVVYACRPTIDGNPGRQAIVRSTDGGTTWTDLTGNPCGPTTRIVVAPDDPNELYKYPYLLYSTDGGATWSVPPAPEGLSWDSDFGAAVVNSFLFDPTDATRRLVLVNNLRIFRSSDSGATWTELTPSGACTDLSGLTLAPSDPRVLFAWGSACAMTSQDGGATWDVLSSAPAAEEIVVSPASESLVYATTAQGVWQSSDGGATWSALTLPFTTHTTRWVSQILPHPTQTSTFLLLASMGVYRTTDGGATFDLLRPSAYQDRLRGAFDPSDPNHVYLDLDAGGILESPDLGASWSLFAAFDRVPVDDVISDPADPSRLIFHDWTGWYESTDEGATWTLLSSSTPNSTIAPEVGTSTGLYLMGLDNAFSLYHSADRGQTWTDRGSACDMDCSLTRQSLVIDASQSNRLWVLKGATSPGGSAPDIARTTDGGTTWEQLSAPAAFNRLVQHPRQADVLFGLGDSGIWRSLDAGTSWNQITGGESCTFGYYDGGMSFDPFDDTVILLPCFTTILHSTDMGATWSTIDPPSTESSIEDIAFATDRKDSFFVLVDGHVYRTSDLGVSWDVIADLNLLEASRLEVTPTDPMQLYVATRQGLARVILNDSRPVPLTSPLARILLVALLGIVLILKRQRSALVG